MKRAARIAAAIGLSAAWFLAASPTALAHAALVRSDPSDGAALSSSPAAVQLWFDEPIRLGLSSFRLSSLDGGEVEPVAVRAIVGNGVALDLPTLPRGVYDVSWSVMSTLDSHLTEGHVLFGVRAPVSEAARTSVTTAAPQVGAGETALRWFDILAAALMVGGLAVAGFVVRARDQGPDRAGRIAIRRRVLKVAVWGAACSLVMSLAALAWQMVKIRGVSSSQSGWWSVAEPILLHGRWAVLWWTRILLLLTILIAVLAMRSGASREGIRPTGRLLGSIVTASVFAYALVWALGSHAASVPSPTLPVLVDAVHVLTACIWMGGLLAIVIALVPVGRRDWAPSDVRDTWRRFGWMAVVSLGLLVATGLLEAARQAASLDALLTTSYGRALLAKSGLLLFAGGLGLVNSLILHPGMRARFSRAIGRTPRPVRRRPTLSRLIAVEGAIGILILLGAGLMASAAPGRGARFAPDAGPVPSSQAQQLNDLLVSLSVSPNLPGNNVAVADVVSTRRPAPAPVSSVTMILRSADGSSVVTSPMPAIASGRYQVGGDGFDRPGTWDLDIVVHRDGIPDTVASFAWRVGDGSPVRAPVFSTRSLASSFTVAGIAVLMMLGLVVPVLLRLRAHSRRDARSSSAPFDATVSSVPAEAADSATTSDQAARRVLVGAGVVERSVADARRRGGR
jgi:copper transport protein